MLKLSGKVFKDVNCANSKFIDIIPNTNTISPANNILIYFFDLLLILIISKIMSITDVIINNEPIKIKNKLKNL